jgi:O-antigen ligase
MKNSTNFLGAAARAWKASEPRHLVLCAGLILQLHKDTRELSHGLLIIWLATSWLLEILQPNKEGKPSQRSQLYALATGLLIVESRTIVENTNDGGVTQFLLIAAGLISTAALSQGRAKRLLQWISLASLTLSVRLLLPLIFSYGLTEAGTFAMNKEVFLEGFGDIHQLRIILAVLSASCFTSLRISKSISAKFLSGAAFLSSYAMVVLTGSRMAMIAPLVGILLGWLISHWHTLQALSKRTKRTAIAAVAALVTTASIKLVILPDLAGGMKNDRIRIQIASCWLRSIWSGDNRFLLGTGHDKSPILKLCTDTNIGYIHEFSDISSSGHAHNTFINLIAHFGLLGFIAIAMLTVILGKSVLNNLKQEANATAKKSLWAPCWSETSITILITIAVCAASNTIYIYNLAIPLVLGLLLAIPLCQNTETNEVQST